MMQILAQPWKIMAVGFLLLLFGFVVPLLMVLDVIKTTFLLGFLSHAASVAGLLLGLVGLAWYGLAGRSKRQ